MADVWTILKNNSSLVSGDAWEHLNNQEGGESTGLVLIDGLEVEMAEENYEIEIEASEITVEITNNVEVEVLLPEYDVEIN